MPALKDANWRQAIAGVNQLPPFSPLVTRLLGALSDENVSFAKVADLIEKEPVVAANVLRMVNSAIYGRHGTVSSIRHAISILGINKLRNTVLAISISNLWNRLRPPKGWSMRDFNRHASATAVLADQLVLNVTVYYAEGAFTAGLLHDLGKLLIAAALPDLSRQIRAAAKENWERRLSAEEEILGFRHEELSEIVLKRWNLPAPVLEAIRGHHQPPDGAAPTLRDIVRTADQCVNQLGITSEPDIRVEGDPLQALLPLGLDGGAEGILDAFQRELSAPEGLLSAAIA